MLGKKQIIFFGFLLLLLVVSYLAVVNPFGQSETDSAISSESTRSSGFPEYDLIPETLKQKMVSLKAAHHNIHYSFWYYFDTDDVNQHYYITDAGMKIMAEMPVTNPQALDLVGAKRQENPGSDVVVAQHPDMMHTPSDTKEEREKRLKKFRAHQADPRKYPELVWIRFIFTEDSVDYSKLKIAIINDSFSRSARAMYDKEPSNLEDVDQLPVPVRGYDYFEKIMVKELMKNDVFTFYDLKGEVTVAFTVGNAAASPNIVKGFSSGSDSYEAYKADGAFIKVLNKLKVQWQPARKGSTPVRVTMPLTFKIDGQNIQLLNKPDTAGTMAGL